MVKQKSTTEAPMYDVKTILFRIFTVVIYVAFGSGIFHLLEKDQASRELAKFEEYYNKTMTSILGRCISNDTDMKIVMAEIRKTFLQEIFPIEWNIARGVYITLHTITTVGYGTNVPRTVGGRMFLVIYATIGIPLMALMLTTFGDRMKHTIKSSIISFERNILKRGRPQNIQRKSLVVVVVTTAVCLCLFSAISARVENWDFSLALYFWFVTITTIGFGDYVVQGSGSTNSILLVLEGLYGVTAYFLTLTLMACILHAISDWVNMTKPPTKEDIKKSLSRITNSLSSHKEEQSSTNISQALPRPHAGAM